MPNTNIVAQRVRFVDDAGNITLPWYNFLLMLFVLAGSGRNAISLTDLQVGPPSMDAGEVLALLDQLDTSPSNAVTLAQIAELVKAVQALRVAPPPPDTTALANAVQALQLEPPPSSGSVTSVALSLPSMFSVTGSPVMTEGTLTGTLATQTANRFFVGPTVAPDAAPTFRSMVLADVPSGMFTATTAGRAPFANGIWVAAQLATNSVTTVKITALNVTIAKLEALVTTLLQGAPVFTIGAEAGNVINVGVQLKDCVPSNLTAVTVARCWLSNTAGGAVTATAPSGTVVIGTNGTIIASPTAKVELVIASNATGAFDLNITEAGAATWYFNLEWGGRLYSSAAITFA